MYGGMYGSSDSGRTHKHQKHHQHHAAQPRQRQTQQSGSVFLLGRRGNPPTSPPPSQEHPSSINQNVPSAAGRSVELSADSNRMAGSDKDLATGEVPRQQQQFGFFERIVNFVRKTWMGLTASEDSELDELEGPTVHYKPEAIETLCQLTKFNRRELQLMYRGFKQECPSGMVKEETFKMIYSQFFPRGADASQYAHFVFNTFDQDNTGAITFTDFVIGLSVLSRGSLQEKLRWTFNLYDINGDGYITKDELSRIVRAVYDLMGRAVEPLVEEHTTREHVERVFNRLDLNKDGVVTIDEFMDSCTRDENISRSMAVLDTIL